MKKVHILLGLLFMVLLSGCKSDPLEEPVTLKEFNELKVIVETQNKTIESQQTKMDGMDKNLQEMVTIMEKQLSNQSSSGQQNLAAIIPKARELHYQFLNAKTLPNKEELAKLADAIILKPQGYLEAMKDLKMGLYEKFVGEYSNEKITLTQNNTYLYESLLTGSSLNKETGQKEGGKFQIKMEFVVDTNSKMYKIIAGSMQEIKE